MNLSEFDYLLPEELIAQTPAAVRDQSRLMQVDRSGGQVSHHLFQELPDLLEGGDLVVINDTRVFAARLRPVVKETGRRVEVLLLRPTGAHAWEALARPGRRLRPGTQMELDGVSMHIVRDLPSGKKEIEFPDLSHDEILRWCDRAGEMPLPPYIRRPGAEQDRQNYQTVYAQKSGSIAAPTAGLHFTTRVLERLRSRGVRIESLTLHVGYGTFQPIRVEQIEEHRVEPERFIIPPQTAAAIAEARQRSGRVVAVGTTAARTLESAAAEGGLVTAGEGTTGLTLCPGYRFRVVDALLTNFHLPKSSLYVLVAAFMGLDLARKSYSIAIRERYRFYSYGDCMLIQGSIHNPKLRPNR